MKINKSDGYLNFNDKEHKYWDNDNNSYISVTTLIKDYKSEFDEEFWSSYKALESIIPEEFKFIKSILLKTKKFNKKYLIDYNIEENIFNSKKQEIVNSYKETREKSCDRGTEIHSNLENQFYEENINKYIPSKDFKCKKDYYKLDLQKGVYPEFLIGFKFNDLYIAGQIDLLIKDGNDLYLVDWKSNKEIKQKSYYNNKSKKYDSMSYPLNKLMDCNYIHYNLQLSLYAYLLQQINPEFNIKSLKIVHFDHKNKETEYDLPYLKSDIEKLIKHYIKTSKIKKELLKDAPIFY